MYICVSTPILSRNVRYLRMLSGMSWKTLGILTGISHNTVKKLEEAETVQIEMSYLLRMCDIFELTMDLLLQSDLEQEKYLLPFYGDEEILIT